MVTAELIDLEAVCAIHVFPWWQDHATDLVIFGLVVGLTCYGFGFWWRGRVKP